MCMLCCYAGYAVFLMKFQFLSYYGIYLIVLYRKLMYDIFQLRLLFSCERDVELLYLTVTKASILSQKKFL